MNAFTWRDYPITRALDHALRTPQHVSAARLLLTAAQKRPKYDAKTEISCSYHITSLLLSAYSALKNDETLDFQYCQLRNILKLLCVSILFPTNAFEL